jgi:predicted dithiol-disulfide oxidoreductase (DUF899 family)
MTDETSSALAQHPVVSREQWLAARTAFLRKEKEFSRLRDELSQARRDLPWEKVAKAYAFDGPTGRESLAQLFAGRSQLVVYHFMFNDANEAGCPHCSFWADHYDGMVAHLAHRDTTFVVVSRASLAKIEAFKQRMGWRFKWVSAGQTDFNYDFHASFRPEDIKAGAALYNYAPVTANMVEREGISVFYRDAAGSVFHTYSTYARGIDLVNGTYNFLDLTPKGRDEGTKPQSWVKHHDRYQD